MALDVVRNSPKSIFVDFGSADHQLRYVVPHGRKFRGNFFTTAHTTPHQYVRIRIPGENSDQEFYITHSTTMAAGDGPMHFLPVEFAAGVHFMDSPASGSIFFTGIEEDE